MLNEIARLNTLWNKHPIWKSGYRATYTIGVYTLSIVVGGDAYAARLPDEREPESFTHAEVCLMKWSDKDMQNYDTTPEREGIAGFENWQQPEYTPNVSTEALNALIVYLKIKVATEDLMF